MHGHIINLYCQKPVPLIVIKQSVQLIEANLSFTRKEIHSPHN